MSKHFEAGKGNAFLKFNDADSDVQAINKNGETYFPARICQSGCDQIEKISKSKLNIGRVDYDGEPFDVLYSINLDENSNVVIKQEQFLGKCISCPHWLAYQSKLMEENKNA